MSNKLILLALIVVTVLSAVATAQCSLALWERGNFSQSPPRLTRAKRTRLPLGSIHRDFSLIRRMAE